MGVSGCGKSTVAKALADTHRYALVEADDFHTPLAKTMMANGEPLTDTEREPWINALCQHLTHHRQLSNSCVLACSGLRRQHRQRFRRLGFHCVFIWLHGDVKLIRQRLATRSGHFFNPQLLDSQFQALQQPDGETDVIAVSIHQALTDVIREADAAFTAQTQKRGLL